MTGVQTCALPIFQYGQASKLNRLISIVLACLGLLAAVVAIVCIIIAGAQGKASNSLVSYTFNANIGAYLAVIGFGLSAVTGALARTAK